MWLQDNEFPGLLITRSFGDSVGEEIGINCIPEIKEHNLCPEDKFIILGSDGVWEHISNQEAAEVVYQYYIKDLPDDAVAALIKEAECRWKKHDTQMDDITCIVIFLGHD